jgi:hypothetical protein
MNVLVLIEFMVFMMNVKEDIISNYGRLLLIVLIVFQLLLLLMKKF